VIRGETPRQPHHLDIAPGLALQPPARLNPVEIAINVELQQAGRMIGRPAGRLGIDPAEPERREIELLDENIDHPNGIVLADPVIETFRKKRALPTIRPLDKALHEIPRKITQES
jgi:hypothetical protein